MPTVYALSAKGQQERDAVKPTLPAELRQVLRLVNGQRTDADLLTGLADKSAVKAGGLRWLLASGYIVKAEAPGSRAGRPSAAAELLSRPGVMSALSGAHPDGQMPRMLAGFMAQSARRWLGDAGYPPLPQIERAVTMQELLPHLHPLIDAIVTKAGADAGAEFADMAAFILNPGEGDTASSNA